MGISHIACIQMTPFEKYVASYDHMRGYKFLLDPWRTLVRVLWAKHARKLHQVSVPGENFEWTSRPQYVSDWCG